MEGCCLLAVAFALTALILCIINRRLKQKNLLLQAELNDFQDHVAELHILLDEISKLGKVKYYIGSIENNMLKNNYLSVVQFQLRLKIICDHLKDYIIVDDDYKKQMEIHSFYQLQNNFNKCD